MPELPNHTGSVDLIEKLALFDETFAPRRVGHVNDTVVKIVKLEGQFVWHAHPNTDELFHVIEGSMTIRYRERDVCLGPGQMHVVARGVEHMTLAEGPCSALIVVKAETLNTGDAGEQALTAHDEPFV